VLSAELLGFGVGFDQGAHQLKGQKCEQFDVSASGGHWFGDGIYGL